MVVHIPCPTSGCQNFSDKKCKFKCCAICCLKLVNYNECDRHVNRKRNRTDDVSSNIQLLKRTRWEHRIKFKYSYNDVDVVRRAIASVICRDLVPLVFNYFLFYCVNDECCEDVHNDEISLFCTHCRMLICTSCKYNCDTCDEVVLCPDCKFDAEKCSISIESPCIICSECSKSQPLCIDCKSGVICLHREWSDYCDDCSWNEPESP